MIFYATLSKSVHADTLGAWVLVRDERTVYDEWNPVAQIDAAGQVVQRHLWGTDLSGSMQGAGGVGGLLGTWDNGATTRDGSEPGDGMARAWVCAYDGNGNVSAVIAATVAGGGASGNGGGGAGTVRVARYDYDAFGKTLATWGDGAVAEANRYRFSTKPEDGTGLLYYGYRYLDTRLGRWVSRDPIGERGGVNLFAFIRSNGVNRIDKLGLQNHRTECFTSDLIQDGRRALQKAWDDALADFQKNPPDFKQWYRPWGTVSFSCAGINGDLLSRMGEYPSCWTCTLEHRNGLPYSERLERNSTRDTDHWIIHCIAVDQDGVQADELTFDNTDGMTGGSEKYQEFCRTWPDPMKDGPAPDPNHCVPCNAER